jgi:hypothetical protein
MSLPQFLNSLFADGRVRVPLPAEVLEDELCEAAEAVRTFEADYRQDLPGTPPPLAVKVARWAALMFYRACQFVGFREVGEEDMARALAPPCPAADPSSRHYTVDAVFRFLPDLMKLARTASEKDPLHGHLARWSTDWPLSSVGIPGTAELQIEPIVGHPCLLRMYVDRIIARRDTARLVDPRIKEAVQQTLGLFPELAPEMAAAALKTNPNG